MVVYEGGGARVFTQFLIQQWDVQIAGFEVEKDRDLLNRGR